MTANTCSFVNCALISTFHYIKIMKVYVIFLVVSVQLLLITAVSKQNETVQEKGQRGFLYLGSVEGKMYFVDDGMRTWRQSREYCLSMNMELATINTDAQAIFLQSKVNDGLGFNNYYWIGARDAGEPRALSWDDTDAQLEDLVSLDWGNDFEMLDKICGIYYTDSASVLLMFECHEYRVQECLCQAKR